MKIGFNSLYAKKELPIEDKFRAVAHNTGNLAFVHSLSNILRNVCDIDFNNLKDYQAVITTQLIWIRQNEDYSHIQKTLNRLNDIPLIPISVGLQNKTFDPKFVLHPNTVKLLKEIEERCIIGVRGYYTAEILNKYGIKNLQVIGCPSMYYQLDYNFKIRYPQKPIHNVALNFSTFYEKLKKHEKHFLIYGADHNYHFIEQTHSKFTNNIVNDEALFVYINKWLSQKTYAFFDASEWQKFLKPFDFAMGMRFHGNVINVWNKTPALFFPIDSRTKELSDFFHFPQMNIEDFDKEKPIEYYAEKADYTDFNKHYPNLLDNFIDFIKKNNLSLVETPSEYYDRKLQKYFSQQPK